MTERDRSHEPLVGEDGSADHPIRNTTENRFGENRFGDQPVVALKAGGSMPSLGFGTWQLEGTTASSLVAEVLGIGVRHIDTAQMYGNEADVAAGIADSGIGRDAIFLTTKIDNDHHAPDALVDALDESLDKLETDHVELALIHWPVDFDIVAATLDTLAQVQASGRAHHIGVSNFTIDQLDRVATFAPLEVLQCECHPFLQQKELRAWCTDRDWVFTAYSPLAQGDVVDDPVLTEIADDHDSTPATIALAWLLAQPRVVTIPRTSDADHLKTNWSALDIDLSASDLERIDELDEGRRLVEPDMAPW